MSNININTEIIQKVIDFVTVAAPELEKVAEEKSKLNKFANLWVDALIQKGMLTKEAKDGAIKDINEGGLAKVAEVFDWVLNSVGSHSFGKTSNDRSSGSTVSGQRESDRLFEDAVLK